MISLILKALDEGPGTSQELAVELELDTQKTQRTFDYLKRKGKIRRWGQIQVGQQIHAIYERAE